jgi:hypothetical protein
MAMGALAFWPEAQAMIASRGAKARQVVMIRIGAPRSAGWGSFREVASGNLPEQSWARQGAWRALLRRVQAFNWFGEVAVVAVRALRGERVGAGRAGVWPARRGDALPDQPSSTTKVMGRTIQRGT